MNVKKISIYVIVAIVLIAGGYFLSRKSAPVTAPGSPDQGASIYAPANAEMALKTASDQALGTYLVASNGMTLYLYTKDTPGVTNCYGQCATNWPPYIVSSKDSLKAAASIGGKIGTTTRTDGTLQLTYNDIPLYYWIKDVKPGDTTGQNVGGVWFVVKP